MTASTIVGEVCGNPNPKLCTVLEAGGVTIYTPLQSLADAS